MITISASNVTRQRVNSLARENFALWMFIAYNDLVDEAEDFVSDDICDRIYCRCLLIDPNPCNDSLEDDDVPF